MKKEILRKAVQILAVIAFTAGVVIFFGPMVNRWIAGRDSSEVIAVFQEEAASISGNEGADADGTGGGADGTVAEGAGSTGTGAETGAEAGAGSGADAGTGADADEDGIGAYSGEASASGLADLREALEAYNEELYETGQSGLRDPFSYETSSFDLTEYGFSQNVIGVLWIPRLNEELPVYLGANASNMAKGAALMGQTSMPLGGVNTNAVIAAHRGWSGIPMFRNIQSIQIGDKIQITTPWETLIYRVCELKIISPDDTEEVLIREGRDLVTLLTCHPYTQNYQRYLVIAERSDEEPRTKEEDLAEAEGSYDSSAREVEDVDGNTILVDPSDISPSFLEGTEAAGAGYSNLQIWMETYGIWIVFAAAVIIVSIAVMCAGRGKKKGRRKKKR